MVWTCVLKMVDDQEHSTLSRGCSSRTRTTRLARIYATYGGSAPPLTFLTALTATTLTSAIWDELNARIPKVPTVAWTVAARKKAH